MKTILTQFPVEGAEFIRRGGVVAFPTETVYGLGADVFDEKAVAKIFEAKKRPNDNPLIAHVGDLDQIKLLVKEITPSAQKFIDAFFPAPLTLVLPKAASIPLIATANLQTIGVRMPQHKTAQEFLKACETPVVAPSANLSGKPSPTGWQAVFEDLDGRIDCILQGEMTDIGLESTVVDCTSETPLILRSGAVTLEQLKRVIFETEVYQLQKNEQPKSPGLKHRHYSPRAGVVLVQSPESGVRTLELEVAGQRSKVEGRKPAAFIGLNEPVEKFEMINLCRSVDEYAHEVFAFFRQCDAEGISIICCEIVEETGIGAALMDRLKRAAEK